MCVCCICCETAERLTKRMHTRAVGFEGGRLKWKHKNERENNVIGKLTTNDAMNTLSAHSSHHPATLTESTNTVHIYKISVGN